MEEAEMQGETKERWLVLCEQATVEQHPAKMIQLIREINVLLQAKQQRVSAAPTPTRVDLPS